MTQNHSVILVTLTLILIITLASGIYFGLQRIDKYLEFKARYDCAEISRFTITSTKDNTTVYYPVEDIYRKCLNEKGY